MVWEPMTRCVIYNCDELGNWFVLRLHDAGKFTSGLAIFAHALSN